MKRFFVLVFSVMLLSGCVKKLPEMKTTLVGRVVNENHNPVEGVVVFITDCKHTYASYTTGPDGRFSLSVDYDELDGNYQLLFSGNDIGEVLELRGRGMELYDYHDVVIDALPFDVSYPYMNYYVPALFGPMTWIEAFQCCANLKFAGHDDWGLPTTYDWMWIELYGEDCYWSGCGGCDGGHICYGSKSVSEDGSQCHDDNELHYFIPQRLVHAKH